MLKGIRYNVQYQGEWNRFIENAKNSTFLFNRGFMDYHHKRFIDHSLMIYDDKDNLVACFPANQSSDVEACSHQGLTYGGLIVRQDTKLISIKLFWKIILEYYYMMGFKSLLYKGFPRIYNENPTDEVDYIMFLLDAQLVRKDTAIAVHQRHPLSYQGRRKRSIKKSKRIGVVIEESDSVDDFYTQILQPALLRRHGVNPVHSLEELALLKSRFPQDIRQFNAKLDGKIVAGTTIFETPNVAHAQYIAALDEGMNIGANDYLFDSLITEIFSHKEYFDFGICNEKEGKFINEGLLEWKEGFGGRSYSHDFFLVDTEAFTRL